MPNIEGFRRFSAKRHRCRCVDGPAELVGNRAGGQPDRQLAIGIDVSNIEIGIWRAAKPLKSFINSQIESRKSHMAQ